MTLATRTHIAGHCSQQWNSVSNKCFSVSVVASCKLQQHQRRSFEAWLPPLLDWMIRRHWTLLPNSHIISHELSIWVRWCAGECNWCIFYKHHRHQSLPANIIQLSWGDLSIHGCYSLFVVHSSCIWALKFERSQVRIPRAATLVSGSVGQQSAAQPKYCAYKCIKLVSQ